MEATDTNASVLKRRKDHRKRSAATHSLKLVHDRLVRQRPNRPPRNKLENRRRDYLEEPTICGGLPKQREIRGQPSLELRDCGGRQRERRISSR